MGYVSGSVSKVGNMLYWNSFHVRKVYGCFAWAGYSFLGHFLEMGNFLVCHINWSSWERSRTL